MSEKTTTIELTSKPIKLGLAVTGIAFTICLIGLIVSFGQATMSTAHWFVAAAITFALYQVCKAARWWQHG